MEKPVVVFFMAGWCGPCRMILANVQSAAKQRGAKFVKVDVDECPTTAMSHNASSIPMTAGYSGGKVTFSIIGASAAKIAQAIEALR